MTVCHRLSFVFLAVVTHLRCSRIARLAVCFLYGLGVIAGCGVQTQRRVLTSPADVKTLDRKSPILKAHVRDGRVYILRDWAVDSTGTTVSGSGVCLNQNRDTLALSQFAISIDSVAIFETNVVRTSPAITALAIISGASLAMTVFCIANPKACFGSCPTFYVAGDDGPLLQAEGFSSSVAPVLEATDIDALYHARPTGPELRVEMKNEALETHVVRHANILAIRKPANGRIFVTGNGEFWEASDLYAPVACAGPEGDCLDEVRSYDGRQRVSLADSAYLATREIIEVEFDRVPNGELGLVLASRQSLLSTYLLYQGLAYMGSQTGEWLARMEWGGTDARQYAGGIGRLLGSIEVQVLDENGEWMIAGNIGETGPLATNVNLVTLPRLAAKKTRIRLRLTKGHWRVDYIALAKLGEQVAPLRLEPTTVFRDSIRDSAAEHALVDSNKVLVTFPGDSYVLTYTLPDDFSDYELFLESRGYYLEWMREEWLEEENLARAAMMFLAPENALRVLAPEFKQSEAGMEACFWNSKYER